MRRLALCRHFIASFAALVVVITATGCTTHRSKPVTAPAQPPAPAAGGAARPAAPPPLTGIVTRSAIESFNEVWKGLRAQDYEPEAASVAAIRDGGKDVQVFAVVATWCPDTRRDLPRFFKIADRAGWPARKMTLLAVDRTKKDARGLTGKWNVTRVPTFIFLRGGQEIGRIVERPTTTLEADMAGIVGKTPAVTRIP